MTDLAKVLKELTLIRKTLESQNELLAQSIKPKRKKPVKVDTKAAWEAYKSAFYRRYEVFPERNGSVNSVMTRIVKTLGADAPHVLYFYLSDDDFFLVNNMHALKILFAKLESFTVRWRKLKRATGKDTPQGSIFSLDAAIRANDNRTLLEEAIEAGADHAGELEFLPEINAPSGTQF